jgi:hypothetical protein
MNWDVYMCIEMCTCVFGYASECAIVKVETEDMAVIGNCAAAGHDLHTVTNFIYLTFSRFCSMIAKKKKKKSVQFFFFTYFK